MLKPEISVIVPTLALAARRRLIGRALESIFGQDGVHSLPLVIVNGQHFDSDIAANLEKDPRIKVIRQQKADLPAAYRLGRRHVTTPWFTTLDDDDVLLPGALRTRLGALCSEAHDAVVTNGYCRGTDADELVVSDMATVAADPLRALKTANWLLPGSWMCKTDASSETLFDGMPSQLECTFLAVRLATTRRIHFIDEPTVVWHRDTPRSASKSLSYILGQPAALRRILELDLPPDVRQCFETRLGAAHHASSESLLDAGLMLSAWKQHLMALTCRGGWSYLPFTRKLVSRETAGAHGAG